MRKLGLLAAGIIIGIAVTEYLILKDKEDGTPEGDSADQKDGLFAEVNGNTVRLYRVKDGRFCGYEETRTFESREEAFDWITKETNAKIVITGE